MANQLSEELKDLKNLVKKGEGMFTEFKLKSNHPEKIVREVVAFANTQGGKLIIGIADNKELKGLKYPDEDEYIISKSIEKYIFPAVSYTVARVRLENELEVLIYDIQESQIKPHFLIVDGTTEERKVYVRKEDKSIQASKELKEVLKGQSKGKSYKFMYGEKENLLIKYLDLHQQITVEKYAEIAQIPMKTASRTLVLLVLAGLLRINAGEIKDYYSVL
jgi:predicted HTH transcriptional regulator